MLILSQDKNGIVNFTNITSILVENKELIARVTNGHKATLGEYDTEERAKEVLQEIIKTYKNENCDTGEAMYHEQLVYEMPEKINL